MADVRAVVRIGELSAELETGSPGGKGKAKLPATGKLKHQALKAAGISASASCRRGRCVVQLVHVDQLPSGGRD